MSLDTHRRPTLLRLRFYLWDVAAFLTPIRRFPGVPGQREEPRVAEPLGSRGRPTALLHSRPTAGAIIGSRGRVAQLTVLIPREPELCGPQADYLNPAPLIPKAY